MNPHRDVRSVVILRALDLGDMLCAVPAFRAIRRHYPLANITLCGLPWARTFVAHYSHLFDDFVEFPGYEGLPERDVDGEAWRTFPAEMAAREFDLAVQMHGSGGITNGLLPYFRAGAMAGYHPLGETPPPGTFIPWVEGQHEIETWLGLTDALGMERIGTHLEFPVSVTGEAELDQLAARHGIRRDRYAVLHVGAKWESRRWPTASFEHVAECLEREGLQVVLTGVPAERELAEVVAAKNPSRINLAGETGLGGFAEVLRGARVIVTNDTGASHMAVAVETPSVTVACGSDTNRWAPLDKGQHPTFALKVECRPCMFERCPYGHTCADIEPGLVARTAIRLSKRSDAVLGLALAGR